MTQLIKNSINDAEEVFCAMQKLVVHDPMTSTVTNEVAILAAGVLIAAQLKNLSSSIDMSEIVKAVDNLALNVG